MNNEYIMIDGEHTAYFKADRFMATEDFLKSVAINTIDKTYNMPYGTIVCREIRNESEQTLYSIVVTDKFTSSVRVKNAGARSTGLSKTIEFNYPQLVFSIKQDISDNYKVSTHNVYMLDPNTHIKSFKPATSYDLYKVPFLNMFTDNRQCTGTSNVHSIQDFIEAFFTYEWNMDLSDSILIAIHDSKQSIARQKGTHELVLYVKELLSDPSVSWVKTAVLNIPSANITNDISTPLISGV